MGILVDRLEPGLPALESSTDPAAWMHERIVLLVKGFEAKLDQEHEIGAQFVTPAATFHLDDVGFWGPDMIMFVGTDAHNQQVLLLQHDTQVSLIFVPLGLCKRPFPMAAKDAPPTGNPAHPPSSGWIECSSLYFARSGVATRSARRYMLPSAVSATTRASGWSAFGTATALLVTAN
jgi:hypothetical protein